VSGRRDVRPLAELLEQPVRAGRNPPQRPVWHMSIRNHATDRTLTDAQWAHIAVEMLAAVGLAPHGDSDAVRWAVVRHAADHIHIVATLVRQDGTTAWAWNERIKAQAAARDLEKRYGLYRVGPVDHTSHRRPGAAERNKAERLGLRQIPRDRLRREVRAAAAASVDERDFFTRLRAAGVLIRLRHSTTTPDEITGYAVGLPDHTTANGTTVWYGGGRLAPDLTLPRLRHRWNARERSTGPRSANRPGERAQVFPRSAAAVGDVVEHAGLWVDDDTAAAACDVLHATARVFEGRRGGPLTYAADVLDRAARLPHRRRPRHTRQAVRLRSIARLIAAMGRLTDDRESAAALQLVLQIALFADSLADLRYAQHRLHQAQAARGAAAQLRGFVARADPGLPQQHLTAATTHRYPMGPVAGRAP
jgi:hypothetical protein